MRFGRGRKSGSGFLNLPYQGSRLPGEGEMGGFNSMFSGRTMSSLGASSGPMTTSLSRDYGPVLEARRQAKLAATDPGLSTRGRVNAPGRATRPVAGGLETRGVRPTAGSRSVGRPVRTRAPRTPVRAASSGPTGYAGLYTAPMGGASSMAPVSLPTVSAGTGSARAARPAQVPMRRASTMSGGATGYAGLYTPPPRAPGYGGLYTPPMGGVRPMAPVNLPTVGSANANYLQEARAGSQSVIDEMRRLRGMTTTQVNVRPRTPVVNAPGSATSPVGAAADTGSRGVRKALGGALGYAKRKPGRTALIAGAGAIGLGALLGGREKRGTSSGSQGMYRY